MQKRDPEERPVGREHAAAERIGAVKAAQNDMRVVKKDPF